MDMEKPENVQIIQKRQEAIEKKEEIQKTVQEMLDPFYCKLCSKGYKRIDQYNEHLSSYDHNHRQVSKLRIQIHDRSRFLPRSGSNVLP